MSRALATVLILVLVTSLTAAAEMPGKMSYQGVLEDSTGSVVADGDYDLTFRIYADSTGGAALWEEARTLSVERGVFNALLGSVTALDLDFASPYWLGISVGEEPELLPRVALAASPYAFRAAIADSVVGGGGGTGDDGDWTVTGSDMHSAVAGNVGVGTDSPSAKLDVQGTVQVGVDDSGFDVNLHGASPGSRFLWDEAGAAKGSW